MTTVAGYTRYRDYSQFQADSPNTVVNGADMDVDFDRVSASLASVVAGLAEVRRSDGALVNGIVTLDAMSTDLLALLGDWVPKGAWLTATAYAAKDVVTSSSVTYVCIVAHTSGVFATDLTAVKWMALASTASAAGMSFAPAGAIAATNVQAAIVELDAEKQPLDASLTALAALTTAADKFIYFSAADTPVAGTVTAFGRSLMDDVNAAAGLVTLGAAGLTGNTFVGTQTMTSLATTAGATIGTTLAVTGAATMASTLAVTGAITGASVGVTGAVTGASVAATAALTGATLATTGNATVGGTLAVTGAATTGALTSGAHVADSGAVARGLTVKGTLGGYGGEIKHENAGIFNVYTRVNSAGAMEWLETTHTTVKCVLDQGGDFTNTGGNYGMISDVRRKENIADAREYLEDLLALRVVRYSLKEDGLSSPNRLGLIAQEVEEVFPGLVGVSADAEGTKTLKTSVLTFMLLSAVQTLARRVTALEAA